MKTVLQIFAGALLLVGQLVLLETTDWGINYLNAHHPFRPYGLLLGVFASLLFSYAIVHPMKPTKNLPYYIWFGIGLAVTIAINLLME
jgi:hypothetical protein